MSRQLFHEGEEVILQSITLPKFNGEYEVFAVLYHGDTFIDRLTGGMVEALYESDDQIHLPGYILSVPMMCPVTGGENIWCQSALRKKHKGSDFSFSELMQDMKCKEPV